MRLPSENRWEGRQDWILIVILNLFQNLLVSLMPAVNDNPDSFGFDSKTFKRHACAGPGSITPARWSR